MPALTSYDRPAAIGSVTIANAASLSDAMDLQGARLVGIRMPATWTAAGLTFQVSEDGTNFVDLYNSAGEVAYTTAAGSRGLSFLAEDFLGWRYVKVRSGTAASPVNQGGARTLILIGASLA